MEFYQPPQPPKGQYRYDPTGSLQGPARLFPYVGDDGMLRYILERLPQNLLSQGRLSSPLMQLFQQAELGQQQLGELWIQLNNLLADWPGINWEWLNLSLPPGEAFSREFVKERRAMTQTVAIAEIAAKAVIRWGPPTALALHQRQREAFYKTLETRGRSRPLVSYLHERDGGLSDLEFARQRLAGCNPTVIRGMQAADRARLQAWESHLPAQLQGTPMDWMAAASAGRLFWVDYPILADLSVAELQPGRYVTSPIALFYQSAQGLEPVLIQLQSGSVVLPPVHGGEADAWMGAKLAAQCADMTHHELIAHLEETHLAMEAFAIATARQLPQNHPFGRLLRPHFRFLLAINQRGNQLLIGEGAAIEQLLAPTRLASIALINRTYRARSFASAALPTQLKQRGVAAEHRLPDFPYRDDALLLWEAIARYVCLFLQNHYQDDGAVQQDAYLQAWAAELGAPIQSDQFAQAPAWLPAETQADVGLDLGDLPAIPRVPDFPTAQTPGQLTSLQQVLDVATQVIFTCTAQHAAVNFSQFDYGGYTPNAPMSLACLPEQATSITDLLPPLERDLGQMKLTFALSAIRWSQIGQPETMPLDRGDLQALKQFQQDLKEIERRINSRNQERQARWGVMYPYLLPSQIPNSINI